MRRESLDRPTILLPPGTLSALKGHHNGIVTVVTFTLAIGGMAAGASAWGVTAALAIVLGMFHIRCKATEQHALQAAQHRIEESSLNVEAIKARHRELLQVEQPSLRLEREPRRLDRNPTRRERGHL